MDQASYNKLVEDVWNKQIEGSTSYILTKELKAIKAATKEWLKSTISLQRQIKKATRNLQHISEEMFKDIQNESLVSQRVKQKDALKELFDREESEFCQCSHIEYLTLGDSNTTFFIY